MDAKTGEDRVKELRRQLYALGDRVHRLEVGVFRTVAAVGTVATVLGYFLPFLSSGEADEDETISLLPAVFSIGDAGGGPFRDEAAVTAVVLGVFAVATLVGLVALLALFGSEVRGRAVRFARVSGVVLLVLCGVAWLLVFALAGHFEDGEVSAFSPATLAFTIGAAAAFSARALQPLDWRD